MADVLFSSSPHSLEDRRWIDSNRALGLVLHQAHHHLRNAFALSKAILQHTKALGPLMDELCRLTCPWCPNPCCIVNRTWFDFQDLLCLHLSAQPLPPGQIGQDSRDPCRYLGPRGCRLPRTSRPWTCTVYLCAVQQACLRKKGPGPLHTLSHRICAIRSARYDLEDAVAQAVRKGRSHRKITVADANESPRTVAATMPLAI